LIELPIWPIRLPTLAEQRAIAAVLGALDERIAVNGRTNDSLDILSRALFQYFFANPASDRGTGRWGTLAELCTTQYGYTASAVSEPVGPKLLRVKDINKRNWIQWEAVPYCRIPAGIHRRYSLSVGDIVVARMADPGKAAIVEEAVDAVFASYLVRLQAASLARAYYVYGFLKSADYARYSESARTGSVQANMNARIIVGARVPVPSMHTMESHLAHILPLRQRIVANLRETMVLTGLRDSLLPRLMSGEIRVRDAEKLVENAT
jgi:type I restriction enzyme S subunit